jgi:hypothetical protein
MPSLRGAKRRSNPVVSFLLDCFADARNDGIWPLHFQPDSGNRALSLNSRQALDKKMVR